jgi:NAD(P)-dependent dehydrogenase (short-subunit alcohol dehydrogenase family)
MRLQGQTAIVSGAGSGIGQATAKLCAEEGAQVLCVDIKAADATAAAIVATGGRGSAAPFTMDVTDASAWTRAVAEAESLFGPVSLLANVAGVVSRGPDTVLEQTELEWQRVLDTDLKSVWLGMRAVLPGMIERGGGRIANVASLAGQVGLTNLLAYSAAKGGVIAMSRQAAMEYAKHGIKINSVAPGIIDTPILGDTTPEMTEIFSAATPLGRLGRPEEIAGAIAYLFSPLADFIAGQCYAVDGGWGAQ